VSVQISSFKARPSAGNAAVLEAQRWLQEMKAKDISLETLAMKAGLERRTLASPSPG